MREIEVNRYLLKGFLIATSLISCSSVYAGSSSGESYVAMQYSLGDYSDTGGAAFEPTVLIGRYGQFIEDRMAIEARVGVGFEDDTTDFSGLDITLKVDQFYGVYGLGRFDLNASYSAYALAGLTSGKATASTYLESDSVSESGFSFGVGIDIALTNNASFNLEYMSYLNKSNFDFTAIGAGLRFGF